jgi:hypothetical protein
MADLRALDFVRCAQFLESRRESDEQVRNIRMFVESWPSLVLATESQNYAEHKRAVDRIDALASRAAAERLNLLGWTRSSLITLEDGQVQLLGSTGMLFLTGGNHRVNPHGASCWHIGCQQGHQNQHQDGSVVHLGAKGHANADLLPSLRR